MEPGCRRSRIRLSLALVIVMGLSVSPVLAWKPLTHANEARKAAEALADDDPLKPILLQNREYLYAGSFGPDIYFFLVPFDETVLSDIAHYCKTGQLADNIRIRAEASGDPALQAFAFGWTSHNVGDSVAHPWVNGFLGTAFVRSFFVPDSRFGFLGPIANFEHGMG
jgi:hypothetical protein